MRIHRLEFRKPQNLEWTACRMLLPDTIATAPSRDYLLAIDAPRQQIAGALSYRDNGTAFAGLRLEVVRGFEEVTTRIQLLSEVLREAADRRRLAVETHVEETGNPALHRFFVENGFRVTSRLFTVEGEMAHAFAYLNRMEPRTAGRRLEGIEIVPLTEAFLSEAGQLCAEYLGHMPEQTAAYFYLTDDMERFGLTQLLLVDGTVQGLMLISRAGETATVHGRIVREQYRRGRASAVLFLKSIERLREAGIERLQFQFFESTHDTAKLAKRLDMRTVSCIDQLSFRVPNSS